MKGDVAGFSAQGGSQDVPPGGRGLGWGVSCCSEGFLPHFQLGVASSARSAGRWECACGVLGGLSLGLFGAFAGCWNLVGSLLDFGFHCYGGQDQSDWLLLKIKGRFFK